MARRARAWLRRAPRPAILMYHRIAAEAFDPWGLAVSPDQFRAQMEWLARKRTVLGLEEFARRQREGTLPSDAVAVTFDDGYACSAQLAGPLLRRIGIPATVFVSPELIERGEEFWWDELARIVLDHPEPEMDAAGERVVLGRRLEEDGNWFPGTPPRTDRQRALLRIWGRLRALEAAELSRSMDELRARSGGARPPRDSHRPMSASEARSLFASGVDVGSHGLTHESLPRLPAARKEHELRDSRDRCEALAGRRPQGFAYPFGDSDEESERLAEEAGYGCACTTQQAAVGPQSRIFALPRLAVGNWTPAQLRRNLALM
ncbi:MAG TPA: polysaccharide deacetylase family protein [Sphingomicrobium sp.]|nr:polysaccharide deacetylase family protein [Sphingomicrobium sp.]